MSLINGTRPQPKPPADLAGPRPSSSALPPPEGPSRRGYAAAAPGADVSADPQPSGAADRDQPQAFKARGRSN